MELRLVFLTCILILTSCVATQNTPFAQVQNSKDTTKELSLSEDQKKLQALREDIPEPVQKQNDELQIILQLMQQDKANPNKIRSRFQTLQRKRRSEFTKTERKQRTNFTKKQKQQRDRFLKNLKQQRESFKSSDPDRDRRKDFYDKQDELRKEFFANQKDESKEFYDKQREESKAFYSEARETGKMFNDELSMMRKRQQDRKKQIKELKNSGATDQQIKWLNQPGKKIKAGN